jgi:hypothetical protein
MPRIHEQRREDLLRLAPQALGEVAACRAGIGHRLAAFQASGQVAVAQFQRRRQLAGAGGTEPGQGRQFRRVALKQDPQRPCVASNPRAVVTASWPRSPSRGTAPAVLHPTTRRHPRASSFSRGRSNAGQSWICMATACAATLAAGIGVR